MGRTHSTPPRSPFVVLLEANHDLKMGERQMSFAHFPRCLRPDSERWLQIHMLSSDTITRWLQTCVRKKPDEEGARRKREKTEEKEEKTEREREIERERT